MANSQLDVRSQHYVQETHVWWDTPSCASPSSCLKKKFQNKYYPFGSRDGSIKGRSACHASLTSTPHLLRSPGLLT